MFVRPCRTLFAFSMLAATALPAHAASSRGGSAHSAPVAAETLSPPPSATPTSAPAHDLGAGFPSFLLAGDVLCLDELDFNAFSKTGKFHTRGSNESCTQLTQLTRVVVVQENGQKSQVRVVGGPMDAHVGWTNGKLPFPGPKP